MSIFKNSSSEQYNVCSGVKSKRSNIFANKALAIRSLLFGHCYAYIFFNKNGRLFGTYSVFCLNNNIKNFTVKKTLFCSFFSSIVGSLNVNKILSSVTKKLARHLLKVCDQKFFYLTSKHSFLYMFANNNGHCTPTKKKQFASEKKKTPRRKKMTAVHTYK